MQRHESEALRLETVALEHAPGLGACAQALERVDHRVAHEADALRRNALSKQVLAGLAARREAEIGQLVGEQTVDLLGHVAVAAAQAGLHVSHGDAELGGAEGGAERRVHVADHHHQIGTLRLEHRLETQQHLCGLLRMAARADAKVVVGLRQAELAEEDVAHVRVVVLPGVHERLPEVHTVIHRPSAGTACGVASVPPADGGHHGSDLHEVGPRAGHMEEVDVHGHLGSRVTGMVRTIPAPAGRWKPAELPRAMGGWPDSALGG